MQAQLNQAELKNTRLELKALDQEKPTHPAFNLSWVLVLSLSVIVLLSWKEAN